MASKSKSGKHEQLLFITIEDNVKKYWHEHSIEIEMKERCAHGKKFYFLDGPPYTAGNFQLKITQLFIIE